MINSDIISVLYGMERSLSASYDLPKRWRFGDNAYDSLREHIYPLSNQIYLEVSRDPFAHEPPAVLELFGIPVVHDADVRPNSVTLETLGGTTKLVLETDR